MKIAAIFGIVCAVLFHTGVILFGGILFNSEKEDHGTLQQVELLDDQAESKKEEKPKEPAKEKKDEMKSEDEKPPDSAEISRDLDASPVNDAPALDAASLSSIEAALNGQGAGGGDFAEALSFASGGQIGGHGKPGGAEEGADSAFSLAEIDQKPRAVYQVAPTYPAELRGKKVEGVVTIIFVVDAEGKVANAHVEKSTDHAFEDPAMNAVRRWKFEPAVRAGQRVPCKMRLPIRFQPT